MLLILKVGNARKHKTILFTHLFIVVTLCIYITSRVSLSASADEALLVKLLDPNEEEEDDCLVAAVVLDKTAGT